MKDKDISKFLSLVLRHKPEALGIVLDPEGWTNVEVLLQKMQARGKGITLEKLKEVVATNDKQRFSFNQDQTLIRASQGHSLAVDLKLQPLAPPPVLYHGTAQRFAAAIQQEGLKKQNRQYVHLSAEVETAMKVGARHGKPVVFLVESGQMHQDGVDFFLSENHVWLTHFVAPVYLKTHTGLALP
ncbi:RNA 2'-phosphotransferase [Rufibacter glacialis]|uniref:Probable RNA 2'-phosphotransferase n=1 Tax=Rufibacter glacialis TaxID=1259555 RepID=A0A5M8QCD6_9BACT|nr:RNA 2'-phosphotransferase [Rufibacter glacialis]KAA6432476.1 RNA 2'-phosphotransferase [Rufibacter glacialis]